MAGMFWIGGHDESDEGGWVWSDGSPFSFFNFKRGLLNVVCHTFFKCREKRLCTFVMNQ